MGRMTIRAPVGWMGPGRTIEDVRVACEGDVISYAGPAPGAPPPEREIVADGFLMPAVADRHVHMGLADPTAVLHGGVTAVRDLAWPADRIFGLADASELHTYNGPLIRAAGPMLTGVSGYPVGEPWAPPGTGRELRGPEDAEKAVSELAGLGAAAIKVSLNAEAGPTPTDAELAAICGAAADRELPVTAHTQGSGQVERALGAGVDELAHTPFTEVLSEQTIQAMARAMRVVSTLGIFVGHATSYLRTALDNLRRFHDAGGRVFYGTDLGKGDWGISPGIHPREALLLREAGLPADEVLATMVRGSLEPGAPADLIVLARDPRHDLEALRELRLVVRAGRAVVGK
jgi:imidazolonepropionase-like amidohydrolase